jgi:hypothetical protein
MLSIFTLETPRLYRGFIQDLENFRDFPKVTAITYTKTGPQKSIH